MAPERIDLMLSRRTVLGLLAAGAAGAALGRGSSAMASEGAQAFSRDWLAAKAERLARVPYAPQAMVPEAWRNLTYDQYRSIWFDGREALWAGTNLPFRLDFFAPGFYFERPVAVSVVNNGVARRVPFDLSRFDRTDAFPDLPLGDDLGYSGIRLRSELRQPEIHEEFAVFQGASYFRAIGTGQTYGLSARGLAVATADPEGEEFPDFTAFWIETPAPESRVLRVHALLDGPSVTGAYEFDISPGLPATMEVRATLFARRELGNIGIAPLTSMFLFDDTNRARFDDFRSAVHDSEGLMIHNGAGEILWRPLANPRRLQVSAFLDSNPKGFGLVQRSRRSEDYADLEAQYHNRPSLWVTPGEGWGEGSVHLVEIPADKEIYDNIVAFWRPADPVRPGMGQTLSYRLDWGEPPQPSGNVATVLNTRIGKGYDKTKAGQIVAIDFADHPNLRDLDAVTHVVSASRGTVSQGIFERNQGTGGARLSFRFNPGEADLSELRAQILRDGRFASEVWLYRWTV
jgi:glucans biosynthesis protein